MKIGAMIHFYKTCSSTNDVAKKLAQEGAPEGTVVIAEAQTAGKGTKGRSWHSPRGKGLYASVILRPLESNISLLPLEAGVAVAEAIREATGLAVRLKWPNDIVWRGRKLGGILCESGFLGSELNYVVLGIGLNIGQKRSDFPADLRASATSLQLATKKKISGAELTQSLWRALAFWYEKFTRGQSEEILRAFQKKLIFPIGKVINVRKDKGSLSGIFSGIDERGSLILVKDGREIIVSPAEIVGIEYNT